MKPNSGVTMYMTDLGVSSVFTANTNLDMASPMLKWYLHETSKGVWSASFETQFKAAIDYCHDHNKGLVARTSAGIDAPLDGVVGANRAGWLLSTAPVVSAIRTFDNEASLYSREVRQPNLVNATSRNNYIGHMSDWMTRLASILAANDKGGHPRWNHVAFLTVPGPENGTEMSLGYGASAVTYTACGTLGATLAGDASVKSASITSPTGPTGAAILRIGSELIHQTSRSGGTATFGKRGHSGSSVASHSAGTTVYYGSAKTIQASYNGYPSSGTAPYDHQAQNLAVWSGLGSLSTYRAAVAQYWEDCCLEMAAVLPDEVAISIAGGQLFGDFSYADDLLEVIGPALGQRFVAGTTNLVNNYPSTNPNEHAWLLRAMELGCRTFTQTAALARLPEPPVPGALQRLVDAGEFALATYDVDLFETGRGRFSNTSQQTVTFDGQTVTTTERGYLLDVA